MRPLVGIFLLTACAAGPIEGDFGAPTSDAPSGGTPQCFSSSECPVGFICSEFGTCVSPPPPPTDAGGDAPPPPEVEYKLSDPISSRRYVWVAMTDQDRLAKIDGTNLEVVSVEVGDQPRILAALPESDTAVVLDSKNAAATVVRASTGTVASELYPTLPNLNRLAVAPGGKHAVAFFDLNKAIVDAGGLGAVGEVGSFQDVTVLAVQSQRSVDLTVGFRPREIEHDASGRFAFVVTDDGISVIDLPAMTAGGPTIVPPIPILEDVFADTTGVEVDVVASGQFAVVRRPNVAELRVVSLLGPTAGQGTTFTLPQVPSDIDLAPDGSRVYAAFRNPAGLAVIDIPGDAFDPSGITFINLAGATGGSLVLSEDGKRGMLFTNATLDERITVVELDKPSFPRHTYPLQKAVLSVGFDPTGTKAVVLHARAPGDPDQAATFDDYIDRKPGYSVLDIATGFSKLQITEVNPARFTFANTAPRAYVTLDGGDAEGAFVAVQQIELDSGVVRTIELGSPPEAIGVLPDSNKIFISQRHPLGRVSFIDVETNQVRTLTGFDLNSQIID